MQHDITLLSGSIFRWEYIPSEMKIFLPNGLTILILISSNNVIHDDILEYKFQFVIWEKMIQLTRGYLGFPVIQNVLLM